MKVLLAHPKGCTDSEIGSWSSAIVRWARADDIDAEVVTGLEDFRANIALDGSFDCWAKGVAGRRDTYTGQPVYRAIFVPQDTVGKATAIIADSALKLGSPVFLMSDHGPDGASFTPVSKVTQLDGENYAAGWRLDT